jgi:hypothetical protein
MPNDYFEELHVQFENLRTQYNSKSEPGERLSILEQMSAVSSQMIKARRKALDRKAR